MVRIESVDRNVLHRNAELIGADLAQDRVRALPQITLAGHQSHPAVFIDPDHGRRGVDVGELTVRRDMYSGTDAHASLAEAARELAPVFVLPSDRIPSLLEALIERGASHVPA